MKYFAMLASLGLIVPHASADSFLVTPNDRATVAGNGTFLGPLTNSPRTYQLLIKSTQLTSFVGMNLNGLTFRLPAITSTTASWPLVDTTFPNYDIYLSGCVDPALRSLTFASNIVGVQTQVRSGPLTVTTGSFPIPGVSLDFGPIIGFNNYLYTGGNLLIEIRHSGNNGASRSAEAMTASGGMGYGTEFSGCWTGSYTGTSGSQGNFSILKLRATPVGADLSGTVAFNDFVGSQAGRSLNVLITAVGSQTALFTGSTPLSASGDYTINVAGLPDGNYDLYLDSTPFLRKKRSLTWTSGGATSINASLVNGDCDNSGEVDAVDIDLVIGAFGAVVGNGNYSVSVDVDGSEEVDAVDIDVVIGNFGAVDD